MPTLTEARRQRKLLEAVAIESRGDALQVVPLERAAARAGIAPADAAQLAEQLRYRGLVILAPADDGADTRGALLTLAGQHALDGSFEPPPSPALERLRAAVSM